MTQDVRLFIAANPDCTCIQIAAALEQPTALVRVALKALRDEGAITSKGNTKGTKYRVVARRK